MNTKETNQAQCDGEPVAAPNAETVATSAPPASDRFVKPDDAGQALPPLVSAEYVQQLQASGHYDRVRYIIEPTDKELALSGHWDTSGERCDTVVRGLQHKYTQTALLLVTDSCFAHCRYCFRKRFVGQSSDEIAVDYAEVARYVAAHPEINNILLSGGDPLTLPTEQLEAIVEPFLSIEHVTSIRFGTKAIVYLPRRLAERRLLRLLERIRQAGKAACLIVHVDHYGELSPETDDLLRDLRAAGVQLLNQTVMLRHINDDPDVLTQTFATVHRLGIRQYYLFQARPVRGATHFQTPLRQGVRIAQEVTRRLNGMEKSFRFVMSHETGKIEILDLSDDDRLIMRYQQCTQPAKIGRVFSRPCPPDARWLDDLPED